MIDPVVLLSFVLVLSLTAHALLGGADYGGACGTCWRRAQLPSVSAPPSPTRSALCGSESCLVHRRDRDRIHRLSRAFAELMHVLHVPLLLVLIGIVLRGSAFVFRAYGPVSTPWPFLGSCLPAQIPQHRFSWA